MILDNNKCFNPKEMLNKLESDQRKREEREKLKLLDKLHSNVLGKNKLKPIKSEITSHKRLIDNLIDVKTNNNNFNSDKLNENKAKFKLIENNQNKKQNSKIEIDCSSDKNLDKEKNDELELQYLNDLSNERMKFFKSKIPEVYEFLNNIKLIRLIESFIEDGFEDLESILGKTQIFKKIFKKLMKNTSS